MQADILMFLQKISNPVMDKFFICITNLGSETFYVIMITYIYWCMNKRLGAKLLTVTIFSIQINVFIKELFHIQRPIYHEGIKPIYTESAPGFSFPSGHTQGTTTFWYYCIKKFKNKKFTYLAVIIVTLVAFSRIYLRVHWPIDIIGGFVFGILVVELFNYITKKVNTDILDNYFTSIIFSIVISVFIMMIYFDEVAVKLTALLCGALIGYFTEVKFIGYKEKDILIKQIIKYFLGLGVFLGLKLQLKLLFPDDIVFNYIRYFILGIWVTFIAPLIFVKLRLAKGRILCKSK